MRLSLPQIARLKTYRCIFFATIFCASGKCPHLPTCYTDTQHHPDDRACFVSGQKRCHLQHTCICTRPTAPSQELLQAYSAWKEKHVEKNPEYDETAEIHGSFQQVFL